MVRYLENNIVYRCVGRVEKTTLSMELLKIEINDVVGSRELGKKFQRQHRITSFANY